MKNGDACHLFLPKVAMLHLVILLQTASRLNVTTIINVKLVKVCSGVRLICLIFLLISLLSQFLGANVQCYHWTFGEQELLKW